MLKESEIEVIDYYKLSEQEGWDALSYEDECKALMKWCDSNDASYYGRPNEDFSLWEAVQMARVEGTTKVVIDNLS